MEGGMACVKYTMFFFNLLTFLAGAALLAAGIWVAVSADTFKNVISGDEFLLSSFYVIIAVGAALFLIGFLGCCGAVNENRCLLGTFFVLVLVLFIVQIVGAVLLIVYRSEAENAAMKTLASANSTNDQQLLKAWDEFQNTLGCCGLDGPSDWNTIPDGCYPSRDKSQTPYSEGCKSIISGMFWVVAGTALGILVIELLAMIFACCMYRAINESKEYA